VSGVRRVESSIGCQGVVLRDRIDFGIEQETEVTEKIVSAFSASVEPRFERDSLSHRKYHALPKATGFFEGDRFSGGG
jgi:hypothetical protein